MDLTRQRRNQISELISRNQIQTQEQLLALLEVEGIRTTQATVSRDLRELGIRKRPEGYCLPEGRTASAGHRRLLAATIKDAVTATERTGPLVVLRTRPGDAAMVAREIDHARLHEVLGAIAGEGIVFVATTTASGARSLMKLLGQSKAG